MKSVFTSVAITGLLACVVPAQEKGEAGGKAQGAEQKPEAKQDKQAKAASGYAPGAAVDASISLTDLNGKKHTLEDYAGKVIVVDFWSMNCPVSKSYESQLTALHDEYAKKGVIFLVIDANANEVADPKAISVYVEKTKVPYAILLDKGNVVADKFGAKVTPHVYLVDAKGVVRYTGAIDDGPSKKPVVREALDAVLSDKEVTTKSTEPQGCTIKRASGKPDAKSGDASNKNDLKARGRRNRGGQ